MKQHESQQWWPKQSDGPTRSGRKRVRPVAVADDDLLAVLAHGWMNSMGVITGAAQTLLTHHDSISPEARADLLDMIATQARDLEDFLSDVFLSARPEVRRALIDIRSRSGAAEAAG